MDTSFRKQLGARIKSIRRTRVHQNQDIFAGKIKIDRTYFAAIEQGKHNPTIEMLKKIADGLGVSLSDLLDGL